MAALRHVEKPQPTGERKLGRSTQRTPSPELVASIPIVPKGSSMEFMVIEYTRLKDGMRRL